MSVSNYDRPFQTDTAASASTLGHQAALQINPEPSSSEEAIRQAAIPALLQTNGAAQQRALVNLQQQRTYSSEQKDNIFSVQPCAESTNSGSTVGTRPTADQLRNSEMLKVFSRQIAWGELKRQIIETSALRKFSRNLTSTELNYILCGSSFSPEDDGKRPGQDFAQFLIDSFTAKLNAIENTVTSHILDLWCQQNPKIVWMIGREEAISMLENAEVGDYLLRFSSSAHGSLVISFKHSDGKVVELLLQLKPTGDGWSISAGTETREFKTVQEAIIGLSVLKKPIAKEMQIAKSSGVSSSPQVNGQASISSQNNSENTATRAALPGASGGHLQRLSPNHPEQKDNDFGTQPPGGPRIESVASDGGRSDYDRRIGEYRKQGGKLHQLEALYQSRGPTDSPHRSFTRDLEPKIRELFLQGRQEIEDKPLTRSDLAFIKKDLIERIASEKGLVNPQDPDQVHFAVFKDFLLKLCRLEQLIVAVGKLWSDPFAIYGMISRDEAVEVLKSHRSGVFLLRFSQSNQCNFSITFIDSNVGIGHSLVKYDANEEKPFEVQLEGKGLTRYGSLNEVILTCEALKHLATRKSRVTVAKKLVFRLT